MALRLLSEWKIPLTERAIMVNARLMIMFLQTILIGKDPIERGTIPVGLFVVVLQLTEVVQMFVAILTMGVVRTLNPMFFQHRPGWKIFRAIMADIVMRRIISMSIEKWPRSKVAFATGHDVWWKLYEWQSCWDIAACGRSCRWGCDRREKRAPCTCQRERDLNLYQRNPKWWLIM